MRTVGGRLSPPLSKLYGSLLERAQRFAPLREDALSDVGLGWPILRRMLHELGARLVASGVLEAADDVYWLRLAELRYALDGAHGDLRPTVERRRQKSSIERRATPPPSLPIEGGATWLGWDFSEFLPARADPAPGAA